MVVGVSVVRVMEVAMMVIRVIVVGVSTVGMMEIRVIVVKVIVVRVVGVGMNDGVRGDYGGGDRS